MAHQIEIVNGQPRMFFVGNDVPWHGLGTQILDAPDTRTAIVAAGLDWGVKEQPLVMADGTRVNAKAIVRDTDNKILCHHIGPDYKPLQNLEAFRFFDPFVQDGLATFETAGSLDEGRRIWVLAKIKADPMVIVPGDEVVKYVLLSNSHDGTMAVRAGFTPIRVVCANTLAMAGNNAKSSLVSIRHTKGMVSALGVLSETMNLANQKFEATADQFRFLAQHGVTKDSLREYVKQVFAADPNDPQASDAPRVLAEIIPLFEAGIGAELPGVRGTYWAAYNAVTEYLQHTRGKDQSQRMNSAWFGQGANLNAKALKVAVKMAA